MCQPATDVFKKLQTEGFYFGVRGSVRDKWLTVLLASSALQCAQCKLSPSFVLIMILTKIPGALWREFNEHSLIFTHMPYLYMCVLVCGCVCVLKEA